VADQAGATVDQPERQVRLALARAAADQHRAAVDRDARGVDGLGGEGGHSHWFTPGKRTTKRAPRRPSWRSSTSIRPSCPSTIALAMASPRPEWRPKSSGPRME